MGRKIAHEMCDVFVKGIQTSKRNDRITVREFNAATVVGWYLHGNLIAAYVRRKDTPERSAIYLSLAGWDTPTTKSRLNALGGHFHTVKGEPHYNDKPLANSLSIVSLSSGEEVAQGPLERLVESVCYPVKV